MVSPAQGDNFLYKKIENFNILNFFNIFSSKMLKRENVVQIQGDFNIFNIFKRILEFYRTYFLYEIVKFNIAHPDSI